MEAGLAGHLLAPCQVPGASIVCHCFLDPVLLLSHWTLCQLFVQQYTALYSTVYCTVHCTALCTALHCALHCPVYCTALCTALFTALCNALYLTLEVQVLCYTAIHCNALYYPGPVLYYTSLQYIELHYTTLHYTAMHCIALYSELQRYL